jgi:hypothetical protein
MPHSIDLMIVGQDERMRHSSSNLDGLVREDVLKRAEGKQLLAQVSGSLFVLVISRCMNGTILINRDGIFRATVKVTEL